MKTELVMRREAEGKVWEMCSLARESEVCFAEESVAERLIVEGISRAERAPGGNCQEKGEKP